MIDLAKKKLSEMKNGVKITYNMGFMGALFKL